MQTTHWVMRIQSMQTKYTAVTIYASVTESEKYERGSGARSVHIHTYVRTYVHTYDHVHSYTHTNITSIFT